MLDVAVGEHMAASPDEVRAVMFDPRQDPGWRLQLISRLDALAIAQLSPFDKPILSGVPPPP